MSADSVQDRLAAIQQALDQARATIADGGAVDLAGLEDIVRAVCDDIAGASPPEDRVALETAIRVVIADLDRLAEALGDQHRRAVAGAGLDAAARSAYGGSDDDGGPDGAR